jgi:hypothetical protein
MASGISLKALFAPAIGAEANPPIFQEGNQIFELPIYAKVMGRLYRGK